MMNLSNSVPSLLNWNVEFIDNAVVLKKGMDKRMYMLNDEHKTPFKMYFLGTFNEYKAMDLKLKYNEYIYEKIDDDYSTKLFSINNYCKINMLMKKFYILKSNYKLGKFVKFINLSINSRNEEDY